MYFRNKTHYFFFRFRPFEADTRRVSGCMRLVCVSIGLLYSNYAVLLHIGFIVHVLCLTTDHNSYDILQFIFMTKSLSSMKTVSVSFQIDFIYLTADHFSNGILQIIFMTKSLSSLKTRKLPCTFDLAVINEHPLSFSTI